MLRFLRANLPLRLWSVTRTVDDEWIMLATDDAGYGIEDGDTFRWSDTFCARMVEGLGPQLAPDVGGVAAYLDAPIGRSVTIGSYVGIPMRARDGELLGTLCAIDPDPRPEIAEFSLPLLELLSGLLGGILARELDLARVVRRAERAEADATRDPLTGLPNRRVWDRVLRREERRCRHLGQSACVVLVDVDGLKGVNDRRGHEAGDALIVAVANVVAASLRSDDVVARIGGDEFAGILTDCGEIEGLAVVARMRQALADAGLRATVGFAVRDRAQGLAEALRVADLRMSAAKPDRRGRVAAG